MRKCCPYKRAKFGQARRENAMERQTFCGEQNGVGGNQEGPSDASQVGNEEELRKKE